MLKEILSKANVSSFKKRLSFVYKIMIIIVNSIPYQIEIVSAGVTKDMNIFKV
jgi:hypothetical protein